LPRSSDPHTGFNEQARNEFEDARLAFRFQWIEYPLDVDTRGDELRAFLRHLLQKSLSSLVVEPIMASTSAREKCITRAKAEGVAEIAELIDFDWDSESKERSWLKLPSWQCQLDGRPASFPACRKH
jgi:hypothetical protein